jgi:hypothetical protein
MAWRAGRTRSALRPCLRTRRSFLPRRRLRTRSRFGLRRPSLMRLGTRSRFGLRRSSLMRLGTRSRFGLRRLSLMRLGTRSRFRLRRLSLMRFGTRSGPAFRNPSSFMRFSGARPALRGFSSLMGPSSTRPAFRRPGSLMGLSSSRLASRSLSLIRTSRSFPARGRLGLVRTSGLRLADRSTRGARMSSPTLRRLRLMPASLSRPALRVTSLRRPYRAPCRHYAPAAKLSRFRSSRDCRPSMVHRSQHRVIPARSPLMLSLRSGQPNTRIVSRSLLRSRGTSRQTSASAVIAHPAHRPVVHRSTRINVMETLPAHPVDRAVVVESSMIPVPTLVPESTIPKAIIDAAIEAHRRPPVTRIPQIRASAPAPISRRPQHSNLRWLNPGSRNPVVALVAIGPVARRPQIADLRTIRLLISHQRRRSDRNRHPHLGHRNRRQNRQQKSL